jgi:hypothetical protein
MNLPAYLALVCSPILVATSVAFTNPRTFFDYQETGGWKLVGLFATSHALSCVILAGTSGITHTPRRD